MLFVTVVNALSSTPKPTQIISSLPQT